VFGRREARELVSRLGGATSDDVSVRTTILVIGAAGFGPAPGAAAELPADVAQEGRVARDKSNKLKRAEDLNTQGSSIQILGEDDFCKLAGVPTSEALRRQYCAMRDLVLRYTALREDHVRYLMKCGIIRPALRTNADVFFAFRDVAILKQASDDLAKGASFRGIVRARLASDDGQLAFDFRIEAVPAKILELRQPSTGRSPGVLPPVQASEPDTPLAEECFRAASALDEGDDSKLDEAATWYRRALEADPRLVPALINLANIHYGRDELVEAQALYERAISLEPDFFEAHFNLGNICHDLGRFPEAQACYRQALCLNPAYADAHFYLAVTFEKMGLSHEAKPHWRAYRRLAPQGEWVELAKEFSD
jgi:tetratricopeptide (TPR) repeat protein